MKIVHSYNKKNGVTYVYEVLESHYNPEKKRSESKRRLIGKLDENGNVISTGKRGPQRQQNDVSGDSIDTLKEALRQVELSKKEQDLQTQKLRSRLSDYLVQEQKHWNMINDLATRKVKELSALLSEI